VGRLFEIVGAGATLLLPAALVDFFARFPEGRPGAGARRLVVFGYAGACVLFVIAALGVAFGMLSGDTSPAQTFVTGGAFAALAAIYFAGAVVAAVLAFVDSVRRAPAPSPAAPRRARLDGGARPAAARCAHAAQELAPDLRVPGERWAGLSLLLVPLGFAYATIVHRVFERRRRRRRSGRRARHPSRHVPVTCRRAR
jgi:hypothetical protein